MHVLATMSTSTSVSRHRRDVSRLESGERLQVSLMHTNTSDGQVQCRFGALRHQLQSVVHPRGGVAHYSLYNGRVHKAVALVGAVGHAGDCYLAKISGTAECVLPRHRK